MTNLLMWAADPVNPMVLGALLYLWTGAALYFLDKPWFGGMWIAYAFANFFLIQHTLTGK